MQSVLVSQVVLLIESMQIKEVSTKLAYHKIDAHGIFRTKT